MIDHFAKIVGQIHLRRRLLEERVREGATGDICRLTLSEVGIVEGWEGWLDGHALDRSLTGMHQAYRAFLRRVSYFSNVAKRGGGKEKDGGSGGGGFGAHMDEWRAGHSLMSSDTLVNHVLLTRWEREGGAAAFRCSAFGVQPRLQWSCKRLAKARRLRGGPT